MDELPQKYAKLFGISLSSISKEGVLRKITVDIKNNERFYIVTPNPEIVINAVKDKGLLQALNSAYLAIPDGIGLSAAYKFIKLKVPKAFIPKLLLSIFQGFFVGVCIVFKRDWLLSDLPIIKGRELFLDIIKLCNKQSWKVYLLGGMGNEAENVKRNLEKNFKSVIIKANSGPRLGIDGTPISSTDKAEEQKIVKDINFFKPDFLFVGFGAPKQEKWLYRWYKKLNIKGSMVVGGTYKFVSGDYLLPPDMVSQIGLEWLWRLLTGSQKISRIFAAVVRFPWEVFKVKLLG